MAIQNYTTYHYAEGISKLDTSKIYQYCILFLTMLHKCVNIK